MLSQRSAPSSPCLVWKSLKVYFCFKRLQEECSGLGALFPELTGEAGAAGGARVPSGTSALPLSELGGQGKAEVLQLFSFPACQLVQAGRKFPVPNPWSQTRWLSLIWVWMHWSGLGQQSSKVQLSQ